MEMTFRFIGTTAVILFVVAVCLWLSLRPSGPRGGGR